MFTGIIAGLGCVTEASLFGGILRLGIDTSYSRGVSQGASVAVDGVCLTVVKQEKDVVFFDVISETLSKTTLGSLKQGSRVHIERSLKIGDELGGHLVSGHVHGVGRVISVERSPWVMKIQVSPDLSKYIFEKGFISLAGASLTVVSIENHVFSVALIPETLKVTRFQEVEVGEGLNIEVDQSTRTIVDQVEAALARFQQQKPHLP